MYLQNQTVIDYLKTLSSAETSVLFDSKEQITFQVLKDEHSIKKIKISSKENFTFLLLNDKNGYIVYSYKDDLHPNHIFSNVLEQPLVSCFFSSLIESISSINLETIKILSKPNFHTIRGVFVFLLTHADIFYSWNIFDIKFTKQGIILLHIRGQVKIILNENTFEISFFDENNIQIGYASRVDFERLILTLSKIETVLP